MMNKSLGVCASVLWGLYLGAVLSGCGGGGSDDTEIVVVKPTPTPTPVAPNDCATTIDGDLVLCLDGDCNNAEPIEEPVVEEVEETTEAFADEGDQTSLQGSEVKLLVRGKIDGVNITINMCSTSSASDSQSLSVTPVVQ
jgi:hypothetical protein